MEVKINREDLLAFAEEYGFDFSQVIKWYTRIKTNPVVQRGTDDQLYEVFETFLQDRSSSEFLDSYPEDERDLRGRSVEESVYNAIYRTYGDEALPYIPETYKIMYGLDEPMKR